MEFIRTRRFDRSLKKLNISKSMRNNLFTEFENMVPEQASQYSYLKGNYKKYKKFRWSKYRILFSYCSECYGKYSSSIRCTFCNGENLSLLVLHDIHLRKFDYQ